LRQIIGAYNLLLRLSCVRGIGNYLIWSLPMGFNARDKDFVLVDFNRKRKKRMKKI